MANKFEGGIWPADDFDSIQIREVYSRYGLAMFMAQVLEHGIVNAAIIMQLLPTIRSFANEASWQQAFDKAFESGLSQTYGNMLMSLEKIDGFPQLLLDRLKSAKNDRDILAHRFFRQNDIAFMSRNGRKHMIEWCEARVDLFQSIANELDDFVRPISERNGISQSWVDEKLTEMLRDAEKWTPSDDL